MTRLADSATVVTGSRNSVCVAKQCKLISLQWVPRPRDTLRAWRVTECLLALLLVSQARALEGQRPSVRPVAQSFLAMV